MKKYRGGTLIATILVCISLVSCDTSMFNFDSFAGIENLSPTITSPLVHAKVTVSSLIEAPIDESFSFAPEEDGTLYFKYLQKNIINFHMSEVYEFPTELEVRSRKIEVHFPAGITSPSDAQLVAMGALRFHQTIPVDFNMNDLDDVEVYRSFLNQLGLNVQVASNGESFDGWMQVTLGSSKVGSDPLTFDMNIKGGMGKINRTYKNVILDFISANKGNVMTVDGKLELDHIETKSTNLKGIDFTFVVNFEKMVHEKVEVNLGYNKRSLPKSKVNIVSSFWNRVEGDAMAFIIDDKVPAFMKLYYQNSVGSTFLVNSVLSVSFKDKSPMESDDINSYIKRPEHVEDGVLKDSYDYISESGANLGSNLIRSIFISQPFEAIGFAGTYRHNFNPRKENISPKNPNFIIPNSKLKGDLEIKLPFYFRATETAIIDTIDFSSDYNFDDIQRVKLIGNYKNSIPMGIRLELVPYDKKNDLTFTHQIIDDKGKEVDEPIKIILGKLTIPDIDDEALRPTHRPQTVSEGVLDSELSQDQLDALKKSDAFILRTVFNTQKADGSKLLNVIVHSEDFIQLNLGIRSVVNINDGDL
ncbi:hypothetical protein K5X82_13100 [Halosquirtibacter xylanolyticus]|uniref:hypothetical protein n=1 Tax=Halosquirtibacter xylanolyticus TaxID=3374599 RepID=UPI0037482032|nr:hypothetical protein K5X82_13100 [Prolixibacteraceae bacterium]